MTRRHEIREKSGKLAGVMVKKCQGGEVVGVIVKAEGEG